MSYVKAIEQGIVLLRLCQQLQSDRDGVDRPEPGIIDKTKMLDQFAQDVMTSITYMTSLYKLMPMQMRLADLGRELERQKKIVPAFGDDYAQVALEYVLVEHGLSKSNGKTKPNLNPADSLRLAINVLKDSAESRRMPSGIELNQATVDLHADAAETLEESLASLVDQK